MALTKIFVWQFWAGLILGHFFLTQIINFVKSKVASV